MNIKIQGIDKVAKQLARLFNRTTTRKILKTAAVMQQTRMTKRILDGINIRGQKVPSYSTKPTYIQRKSPFKGKLKGYGKEYGNPPRKRKRFKSGKKAGKIHTSQYFAGGYAEFRRFVGRGMNNRFELTGKMLKSIQTNYFADGAIIGFTRREEALKMAGNHKRFNIWGTTPRERAAIMKDIIRMRNEYIITGHVR